MTNQDLQILVNVYNVMMTIKYTEDGIFKAAEGLGALQNFIMQKNKELQAPMEDMINNKED